MRMFQVDAFTATPFRGNPAAVLVLDDWLPEPLMQAVAQENNLAETAFAKRRPDGNWDLRWFTPAIEVDFCGHATLATAHILFTRYEVEGALTFHTRVGALHVSRQAQGYRLDIPRLDPEPLDRLPPEITGIFPQPPAAIFRNFENIYADLGSAEAVRDFVPDLAAIAELGQIGLVVTGAGGIAGETSGSRMADFTSRYFAPGAGIPEDPVTGSIHATLVPYWAEKLGRDSLLSRQASARGGWLACSLSESRVFLAGDAVTFMEATIFLPESGGV